MNMAMYNAMYIVYIMLVSASFFAFILTLTGFDVQNIPGLYSAKTPVKRIGGFLVFLFLGYSFVVAADNYYPFNGWFHHSQRS